MQTANGRANRHLTGAVSLLVILGSAMATRNARAWCDVDENFGQGTAYIECGASGGNGEVNNDILGVVGSDPWGQWIGWLDMTTGECLGWDQIGSTTGFNSHTRLIGYAGDDFFVTVSSPGEVFCGYPLDPPVANGHLLTMGASYYSIPAYMEGSDSFVSYMSTQTNFTCPECTGLYVWTEAYGLVDGSPGGDAIIKAAGSGTWNVVWANDGDDEIWDNTTFSSIDCGFGNDTYHGFSSNSNCENVN
jgi:hypothetical protein